jgi:hypothetical protein
MPSPSQNSPKTPLEQGHLLQADVASAEIAQKGMIAYLLGQVTATLSQGAEQTIQHTGEVIGSLGKIGEAGSEEQPKPSKKPMPYLPPMES